MGQTHSNKLSTTDDDNKQTSSIPSSPTIQKKRSLQQLKQKLTRSELIALKYTFNQLKTVSNHLEYIELKSFLQHMNLPTHLESAGILLFKSFSYLGSSYPYGQLSITSTATTAPLLLSWDAFLTAFVILTGKLDADQHHHRGDTGQKAAQNSFEEAFFESLSILPSPPPPIVTATTATTTTTTATITTTTTTTTTGSAVNSNVDMDSTEHIITNTKGLSLADLGIQFDDMDDDMNEAVNSAIKKKEEGEEGNDNDEKEKDQSMRILSSDLKELFGLALWIVHVERNNDNDKKEHELIEDIFSVKTLATQLINNIQSSHLKKKKQQKQKLEEKEEEEEEEETITHDDFYTWKKRNAPYLFKTIQSFIYTQFTMKLNYYTSLKTNYNNSNQHEENDQSKGKVVEKEGEEKEKEEEEEEHFDIILSQDRTPIPDQTDILTTNMCALLSWCLPEDYFTIKQWHRLYSGDKDGFSMNRFESHVFKYSGPTLILMKIQTINNNNESDDGIKIIGGLITVPWKQSKHYWGNDQCFLFELYPTFECYRSKQGMNQQYIYCHSDFGFGFGGTSQYMKPPTLTTTTSTKSHHTHHQEESIIDQFMIYLDNSLQTGQYYHDLYPHYPTFEKSMIQQQKHSFKKKEPFETLHVEVFGLGNEKLTQLQKKAWQFEAKEALRRQGLQIRQSDGQVDKEILRMAGIIQGDSDHYRQAKNQD